MATTKQSFQNFGSSLERALASLIFNQQKDKAAQGLTSPGNLSQIAGGSPMDAINADIQFPSQPRPDEVLKALIASNPAMFGNPYLQNELKGVQAQQPVVSQRNPYMDTVKKDPILGTEQVTPGQVRPTTGSMSRYKNVGGVLWDLIDPAKPKKIFDSRQGKASDRIQLEKVKLNIQKLINDEADVASKASGMLRTLQPDDPNFEYWRSLKAGAEGNILEFTTSLDSINGMLTGGQPRGGTQPTQTPQPTPSTRSTPQPVPNTGDDQWIWDEATGTLKPVQ